MDAKKDMRSFSKLLEELREAQQISKKNLAIRAGLTPGYVSLLTRGERTAPSEETVEALADALNLGAETRNTFFKAAGYAAVSTSSSSHVSLQQIGAGAQKGSKVDWGEAPDVGNFYGRQDERARLEHWAVDDRCRVIAILGIGGIGKTSLVTTLAMQVKDRFDYVFWSSLQDTPPVESILRECIQFLSDQKPIPLPEEEENPLPLLLELLLEPLRNRRCLIVLDNFESVLQSGERVGEYRESYEGYGRLIQRVGETDHQSCFLLTSREKPREIVLLESDTSPVRSLVLTGVGELESKKLLEGKGIFGSDEVWARLVDLYSGNPLALKLVSEPIRELFGGDIAEFLGEGGIVVGDMHNLLNQQFGRLSELEEEIMYWLAIEREPVSLKDLQENIVHPVSRRVLLEAADSLRRRSMIETSGIGRFTLQPVIMEHVTDRFVEKVCKEIVAQQSDLLESYALIKAQAKDYIRERQVRLVLTPVAEYLLAQFGKVGTEQRLKSIISRLRQVRSQMPGYTAGNVLNLLIHLHADLQGADFSQLTVWQAYLQGVALPNVDFAQANLAKSVFTDTLGSIFAVALDPNGELLAAGTDSGDIRLWQATSGKPLLTCEGHLDWVRSVAFSPDGRVLASGSDDQSVRLWDVNTGQCLKVLQGHTNWVWSVTFSPDGRMLASSSDDQSLRLWDVNTGQCLKVLQGHTHRVHSVAFSPDGRMLASGSADQSIRLWDVNTGQCLNIMQGYTHWVYCVAFSPDGRVLASGSNDQSIRLWEVSSGQCLNVLQGHTNWVHSVAFSPDGDILASGSDDQSIRLWDVNTGQCLNILHGHTHWIYSVAFSPDGRVLASGSADQSVRLWDINTGQRLKTLQGYTNWVWSVTFSPDGRMLASGSDDQNVRLWDVNTGQCLNILHGHTHWVHSVAFSPDGHMLASGSDDQSVRLWDVNTGQCLKVLQGHTHRVHSVAFSPDGHMLASSSDDQSIRLWDVTSGQRLKVLQGHTHRVHSVAFSPDGRVLASSSDDQSIRLWDVTSGQCLKVLQGHTHRVHSVAFSPDGRVLASGSADQSIRLWDVNTGQCLKVLQGHIHRVYSVAFSPDGRMLASGSADQSIRLWDVNSGQCLKVLQGHANWVWSVAFSPNGRILASGSQEGTIKLWDVQMGECLQTLRSERPYEGMNITHVAGLTVAQKAVLRALGAIEK